MLVNITAICDYLTTTIVNASSVEWRLALPNTRGDDSENDVPHKQYFFFFFILSWTALTIDSKSNTKAHRCGWVVLLQAPLDGVWCHTIQRTQRNPKKFYKLTTPLGVFWSITTRSGSELTRWSTCIILKYLLHTPSLQTGHILTSGSSSPTNVLRCWKHIRRWWRL